MNNEPVAWRIKNPQMFNEWIVFSDKEQASLYAFHNGKGNLAEPLYTHSAKILTDEEILDICIVGGFYDRIDDPFFDKKTGAWSLDEDLIEFARAILRKAQER
jgi:hypothetical protein